MYCGTTVTVLPSTGSHSQAREQTKAPASVPAMAIIHGPTLEANLRHWHEPEGPYTEPARLEV